MERFSLFFVALFFLVSLAVAYGTEEEKMKSKSGHEEMCRADSEGSQCSEKHESKADEAENENLRRKNFQSDEVDDISELKKERSEEEIEEELKQTQSEEQEYLKGSACSYCTYCKFCKLCDKDCPCEASSKKPNCGMCKYCKYCYLCKMGCDTICQPGGLVDRFTSYVSNHLPKFNKDEVDNDIQKVKKYIDDYKEEL